MGHERREARGHHSELAVHVRALLVAGLTFALAILAIYTVRHYVFTLRRMFGHQRHPYEGVFDAVWPRIAVLVPAHNEEAVVGDSLRALLASTYPVDRMVIIPVDDRSSDGTRKIILEFAAEHPGRVVPHLRDGGIPGKAAALAEATRGIDADVFLMFDADYLPGPELLKQLAAPFLDPEVGAVMGRVVPINVTRSLLPRLLDLERSGGYQVDQQARMSLGLVPQFGGTVGGVRRTALAGIGGWRHDALAEDTDVTFRLVLAGWQVVYVNRAECYEEVPETWPTRYRQIRRWAIGHNQALRRYSGPLIRNRAGIPRLRQIDGLLLLGVFMVPVVLLLGWACTLGLLLTGEAWPQGPLAVLAVASFSTVGNSAAFFQVAAAAWLDGSNQRIRLLTVLGMSCLVSAWAALNAAFAYQTWSDDAPVHWHKTERWRQPAPTDTPASPA